MSCHILWMVNKGNTAPSVYRKKPFAAIAEAPFKGPYTSTMYMAAEIYKRSVSAWSHLPL